jgi:hypothetical protein
MHTDAIKRKMAYGWRLLLLDIATLLFVGGIISTVSGSVGGSSAFTLSLILAGAAIEGIRRASTKVITASMVAVDLITLAFMAAVISNPLMWGMLMIAMTLLSWGIVQALRYFVSKSSTPISAAAQVAITAGSFFLMVSNPNYPAGYQIGWIALISWIVAEAAWIMIERRLFSMLKAKRILAE